MGGEGGGLGVRGSLCAVRSALAALIAQAAAGGLGGRPVRAPAPPAPRLACGVGPGRVELQLVAAQPGDAPALVRLDHLRARRSGVRGWFSLGRRWRLAGAAATACHLGGVDVATASAVDKVYYLGFVVAGGLQPSRARVHAGVEDGDHRAPPVVLWVLLHGASSMGLARRWPLPARWGLRYA
jgi:hypothetical protein